MSSLFFFFFKIKSLHKIKWFYSQWQHQGGAWGHFPPPQSKDLSPYLPPCQKENMAKISHFQQIFGYLPPQNAFCSLDAPQKKKKNLVPPLFRVYIFITFDHDVGYLEWFTLHPQAIKISCFSFTCYIRFDHSGLKMLSTFTKMCKRF